MGTEKLFLNTVYDNNVVTEGTTKNIYKGKNPSISSTSEYELNDKNTIGVILEAYQGKRSNTSEANGSKSENNQLSYFYDQNQNSSTLGRNFELMLFINIMIKKKQNFRCQFRSELRWRR